jgi:PAS domain-containing protein
MTETEYWFIRWIPCKVGSMENPSLDALTIVSETESADDLKRETAQDALSIVIDAINSSVGGLIISDLSGTIRFANPAFCTMFEYPREEIIGMDAAELFASRKVRKLIESYILEHSKADFSHGICPECTKKLYPELFQQV